MNALWELIDKGGPAMMAIIALSVVLYSRCFKLLLTLRHSRRRIVASRHLLATHVPLARHLQSEIRESFQQQRVALGAMIAAAPLLGLLGTVSGMVTTFESLAAPSGGRSMEGLAQGISEVLVATESGLLVALPALLFVYFAHREVLKHVQQLNLVEQGAGRRST